jgi:hypothetical protein
MLVRACRLLVTVGEPVRLEKLRAKIGQIDFSSTFFATVVLGATFITTGTLDPKFISQNLVGLCSLRSFLGADIARSPRSHHPYTCDRICQEIDSRLLPFRKLWVSYDS